MKIFLPSFFKIRVVALINFFILFFLFFGMLKTGYAVPYTIVGRGPLPYEFTRKVNPDHVFSSKVNSIVDRDLSNDYVQLTYGHVYNWQGSHDWNPGDKYLIYICDHHLNIYYPMIFTVAYTTLTFRDYVLGLQELTGSETQEQMCNIDLCQQEKENLISLCGGEAYVDWDTWIVSECTGKCKISINANLGSPNLCPIP